MAESIQTSGSPSTLVAMARAAHLVGDKELEVIARRELEETFGITIEFTREEPKKRNRPVLHRTDQ